MQPPKSASNELVVSYLTLRRLIGAMGLALPVLVTAIPYIVWKAFDQAEPAMQGSISDYYGTASRDVFVGILFALGAFLFSYRGHPDGQLKLFGREVLGDNGLANISAAGAFATALFPVTSEHAWVRGVHVVAAGSLFVTFAIFALFQFTRGKSEHNTVYRWCGGIVLALLGCIGVYKLLPAAQRAMPYFVFYIEAAMLSVFGVAWMIKGRALESEIGED